MNCNYFACERLAELRALVDSGEWVYVRFELTRNRHNRGEAIVRYYFRRTNKRRVQLLATFGPHVPLREAADALSGTDAVINPRAPVDEEAGEYNEHATTDGSLHPLEI